MMIDDQQKTASENLLLFLRQDAQQEKFSRVVTFTTEDWQGILEVAQRHNLTSVLFWELNRLAPDFEIPDDLRAQLRQASLQAAHRNMKLFMELRAVLQALNEQGIPTIVLKGAHLAALVYPDISMRTMGDIDIMVPKERLGEAAGVLERLEYQAPKAYELEPTLTFFHHLPTFRKPNPNSIDLHWRLFPPTYPFALDLDKLWEQAQPAIISNTKTLVLSPEDSLLHLSIHSIYHHQFAMGLRALFDIAAIFIHSNKKLNWERISNKVDEWKANKPVFLTLQITKELLNVEIPNHALDKLKPQDFEAEIIDKIKYFTIAPSINIKDNFVQLFDSKPTNQKIVYSLKRIFKSRKEMALEYSIPFRSPRIYLYYLIKIFTLSINHIQIAWRLLRRDPELLAIMQEKNEILRIKKWLEPEHQVK